MDKNYLEDLIWMSYRYCIGRKTIATSMHAGNIAKYSYNNIPDDRKEFMAHDIRREINSKVWLDNVSIADYRPHLTNDVVSLLIWSIYNYFGCNPVPKNWNEKSLKYDLKDGMINVIPNLRFDPDKQDFDTIENLYDEFIPWIKLANALDKAQHKTVITEINGKIEEHVCFQFPLIGYNFSKIEEAWVELDSYLDDPFTCKYIDPTYIKEIR